jgi:hypothetical protein
MAAGLAQIATSFVDEYKQKRAEGGAVQALLEDARMNTILADRASQKANGFPTEEDASREFAQVERIVLREDISLEAKEKLLTDWKANCLKRGTMLTKAEAGTAVTGERTALDDLKVKSAPPAEGEGVIEQGLSTISQQNERKRQDEVRMTGPESRTGFKPGVTYATLPSEEGALAGVPAASVPESPIAAEGTSHWEKTLQAMYGRALPYGNEATEKWASVVEMANAQRAARPADAETILLAAVKDMDGWMEKREGWQQASAESTKRYAKDTEVARIKAVAQAKGRAKDTGDKDLLKSALDLEKLIKDNRVLKQRYSEAQADMKTMTASKLAEKWGSPDPIKAMGKEVEDLDATLEAQLSTLEVLYERAGVPRKPGAAPVVPPPAPAGGKAKTYF